MATLTGALKDFTPQPLGSSANAVLVFTPYGPAGSSTKSLLVSREIRVSPASDGSFTVDLAAYASTNPRTAYKLRVEWMDSAGNYLTTEEIPWAIVVSGDGSLVDMFADVQAGKLLVKGDKGDSGNVVQQAAIDALTAKNTEQDGRLTTNEAKNVQQDGRLAGVESKNTAQDGRLDAVEAQNAAQDAAITAARTGATTDAKTYTDAEVLKDRNRLTSIESKNATQDTRLAGLDAVSPKVSNIALDADGTPYYKPGSTEVHIIPDGDDVPYFITFLQAAVDTDGALYF